MNNQRTEQEMASPMEPSVNFELPPAVLCSKTFAKTMNDDQKPCRTAFGQFTLVCAMIGFLLFVVYQVASIFSDMAWIDGIPNWLGFAFLFIFGCSIVWEVKLMLDSSAQQYKTKAKKADMAPPRKPSD